MPVSVLILTLDEEVNLPGCLASVSWCDDVVVLDSYSTDATEQITREHGARFIQREFDNYSLQRNWALENIQFENEWVFSLDADERFTPELAEEVNEASRTADDETSLYLVRRKDHLMGRWIKHSSSYPIWLERLYRPERVWMSPRIVNEHMETDGEIKRLEGNLLHYPFNRGIGNWLTKHNRYAAMEARICVEAGGRVPVDWRGLVSLNGMRRRTALKELSFRLPGRPWLKFFYLYLLRGGFLDGRAGLTYCTLQSIYEYFICLQTRELMSDNGWE